MRRLACIAVAALLAIGLAETAHAQRERSGAGDYRSAAGGTDTRRAAGPGERGVPRRVRERYRPVSPDERQRIRASWRDHPEMRGQLRARMNRSLGFGGPRGATRAGARSFTRRERTSLREQIAALPPEERRALHQRFRRYDAMPEGRRAELHERLRHLLELESGEREQLSRNARRFRSMEPGERERLRAAYRRLRDLPPDEQQRLLDRVFSAPE